MALIKCKECGCEISDKAQTCPNCGYPISVVEQKEKPQLKAVNNEQQQKSKWGLLIGVIVCVLLLGAAIFFFLKNESRQIVLTPELTTAIQNYDEVHSFYDGLALVVRDGKYGYINERGEEVIPCQRKAFIYREGEIDEAILPDFSEGMAVFYTFTADGSAYNGVDENSFLYGYINKNGEEVIPAKYKEASKFNEGIALVTDVDNKQYFIDKSDNKVAEINSEYKCHEGISNGLALVSQDSGYESYGYIDKTGKVVIPLKYSEARSFSEGLAYVSNDSFKGFIDIKGNEVISCNEYYEVGTYHEGLVSVIKEIKDEDGSSVNWKLGFMDKKGKIVIPFTLPWHEMEGGEPNADIECFSDGLYGVADENRFIDNSGKTLFDYDRRWQIPLNERFSEGLIVVNYGNQYGLMDKSGKVTISDAQIKKEEARRAEEEEKQRQYEEEQRQLEEQRRLAEQGPEWLQGTWRSEVFDDYGRSVGYLYNVFNNGTVQLYAGEKLMIEQSYKCEGDMLICDKGSYRLDNSRQVVVGMNGQEMEKVSMVGVGNSHSNSDNRTSYHSSTRFSISSDVIRYLSGKTFAGDGCRIRIHYDGVYINGRCVSAAPTVERFESYKAIVRANLIPNGLIRFIVIPSENKIVDQEGITYLAK